MKGDQLKCLSCGHEWVQKNKFPVRCPAPLCRSLTWNTTGAAVHRTYRPTQQINPDATRRPGVQTKPRCNGSYRKHTFAWVDVREEKGLPPASMNRRMFYTEVCLLCGFRGRTINYNPYVPKPPMPAEKRAEITAKALAGRWKDHVPKPKKPKRTPEQRSRDARKAAAASNAARAKRKMEALRTGAFYAK